MADAASFILSLEEKISGPAKAGVSSLADLDAQIKKDSASLKTLEAAQKKLEASGGASEERMNSLKAAIDGKKASIAGASEKVADLAGKEGDAAAQTGLLDEKMAALGGPMGIAIAVATALAAALVFVGSKLVGLALSAAGAQRHQLNLATAMTGSTTAARAMVDATTRVSQSVALQGDKVTALGNSLAKSGLSGKQYEETLKNIAQTASVAGDEAANAIKSVIEKSKQLGSFKIEGDILKGTGLIAGDVYKTLAKQLGISVKEVESRLKSGKITADQGIAALNESMKSKFGALAGSEMLDFDTQIAKAGEGFAGMFRDVKIEPFLQGLHMVLGLLDENTAAGKVIKSVLVGAMDGFFAAAGAVMPYVKSFFIQLAIAGLKLYIAFKPTIAALGEIGSALASAGGSSGSLDLIKIAAYGIVGAIALVVGVAAMIAAPFVLAIATIAAFYALCMGAFDAIAGGIRSAMSIDLSGAASAMIDGLVSGITSGASRVISAVTDLAGSAVSAVRSALDINSPSKVFAKLGASTGEGMAMGIDDGSGPVEASMKKLVALPDVPSIAANDNGGKKAAARGGEGGGSSFQFGPGSIVIHVAEGAGKDEAYEGAKAGVLAAFEELAAQVGASTGEPAEEAA